MGDDDAAVFRQLDGQHALPELITDAEVRFGPGGATRLARLLADLGERGLAGGRRGRGRGDDGAGGLAQALKPREFEIRGLGRLFERIYLAGGWILFTRAALIAMAALGVAGLARVRLPDRCAATGRRSWSPTGSASARSSSCSAASSSSPCTSSRTGSSSARTGGASHGPG